MSEPNDGERTRERMVELGRASGRARREKRERRRSRTFLDALRDRVRSDPDALVAQLLTTGAGAVVAARVLERAGFEEETKAEAAAPVFDGGVNFTSLAEIIHFAYQIGAPASWGLPTTHAELDALLALAGTEGGGGQSRRSPTILGGEEHVSQQGRSLPISESHAGTIPPATPKKPDPLTAQAAFFQQRKRELEAKGWHVGDGGITREEELQLKAERDAQRERERWQRV